MLTSLPSVVRPPSYALLATEPFRAVMEFAANQVMDERALPRGDSHAVVVFPGLATSKLVTRPLLSFCDRLGYCSLDWGLGWNRGPQGDMDAWLDTLAARVLDLTAGHAAPISLVGWSLGGIYAREVAKRCAHRVRQVVTIGSPFAGLAEHTNVGWIYRLLNGSAAPNNEALRQRLLVPPPVPNTAIFSRGDGVVAWQTCLANNRTRQSENIEVAGSHCGMPWNPAVLRVLADRLAQAPGAWKPYLHRHAGGLQ